VRLGNCLRQLLTPQTFCVRFWMSAWPLEQQLGSLATTMASGQLGMAAVASPWATGSVHLEADLQWTKVFWMSHLSPSQRTGIVEGQKELPLPLCIRNVQLLGLALERGHLAPLELTRAVEALSKPTCGHLVDLADSDTEEDFVWLRSVPLTSASESTDAEDGLEASLEMPSPTRSRSRSPFATTGASYQTPIAKPSCAQLSAAAPKVSTAQDIARVPTQVPPLPAYWSPPPCPTPAAVQPPSNPTLAVDPTPRVSLNAPPVGQQAQPVRPKLLAYPSRKPGLARPSAKVASEPMYRARADYAVKVKRRQRR
jgi:hypothetical protein